MCREGYCFLRFHFKRLPFFRFNKQLHKHCFISAFFMKRTSFSRKETCYRTQWTEYQAEQLQLRKCVLQIHTRQRQISRKFLLSSPSQGSVLWDISCDDKQHDILVPLFGSHLQTNSEYGLNVIGLAGLHVRPHCTCTASLSLCTLTYQS